MKHQQGFTLIELMIALVLGLLIIAAVVTVVIVSTRTTTVQQAGSSILDANVFGLQVIEKNIRMAGLGLNDISKGNTAGSGVIAGDNISAMNGISGFVATQLTRDGAGPANTNSTNGSDQLTIQYRAPANMRDCEGQFALGPHMGEVDDSGSSTPVGGGDPSPIDGQVIVERYFLQDNGGTLELRCDASRYMPEAVMSYSDLTTADETNPAHQILQGRRNRLIDVGSNDGVVVISGIDDFQIKFGVVNDSGNDRGIEFLTPAQYNNPANIDRAIVAVQIGLLTKGNLPISEAPASPTYSILGDDITMKTDQGRFIRRVYETTVMLRNSRDRV